MKAVKAFVNESNKLYKDYTLLWYGKKERYLHEISIFIFTNVCFLQAYLIWAPKLDAPKTGIPLAKRT